MAQFLHHEPCPRCRSKDNLARYSDGSGWCWGCHLYQRPRHKPVYVPEKEVIYPTRVSELPQNYVEYYAQYLTKKEIDTFYKYDLSSKRAFFTVKNYIEYRNIYNKPKTISNGNKPFIVLYNNNIYIKNNTNNKYYGVINKINNNNKESSHRFPSRHSSMDLTSCQLYPNELYVVEDLVSAIVVGRQHPCLPLFGSNIPLYVKLQIAQDFKKLYIWLDYDKYKEAINYKKQFDRWIDCEVICTKDDPKAHHVLH